MLEQRERCVVVLDRDGTIIEEREYLSEPDQVKLIPGVGPSGAPADGIRLGGDHESVGCGARIF